MSTQSILNVVRGIEPWKVLRKLGVQRNGDVWNFEPYSDPVLITADDLIMGFRRYSQSKLALREWATFLLVASNIISFDALEDDPRADELLNAIWQASFGEEITLNSLAL
jgi:hypothetical protein